MIRELQEKIQTSIKEGRFDHAKKLLGKLTKIKGLSWKDQIRISEFYSWIGEPKAGIKVLGSPLGQSELDVVSTDELCIQIRLSYMLAFIGAHHLAGRQFQNIERSMKRRNIHLETIFPKYFQYVAHYYLAMFEYEKAALGFEKSIAIHGPESDISKYAQIGLADCLDGMGEADRAIAIVSKVIEQAKVDERILLAICFQARGEYLFRSNQTEVAKADFDQSQIYFSEMPLTKDQAYLLRCLGGYWIEKKDFVQAEKCLTQALEIIHKENFQPIAVMGVLYWLELLPKARRTFCLTIGYQIALRAYFYFSPYSLLVGRQIGKPYRVHPWYQKQVKSTENNCWLVKNGTIEPFRYDKLNLNGMREPILDLFSGILFHEGRIKVLSEIQSLCLLAILGAGDLGISIWSLMDIVYQQDFTSIDNGLLRIDNLLKRISGDFPIVRKKTYYFFERTIEQIYILPMGFGIPGPFAFFKRSLNENMDEFIRGDVEKVFQVTSSTANRWISDWTEGGLIKKRGQSKASKYYFTSLFLTLPLVLFFALSTACSSAPVSPKIETFSAKHCEVLYQVKTELQVEDSLKLASDLFEAGCYQEVISLGSFLRTHSRDKYYYLLSETFEVFVPEGTFVEYVMESFERSYLSFLMSVSYYYLIKNDSAQVELRKTYLEGQAFIYNYGDDAVNLILQAILWENIGDKNMARPLWKRASELLDTDLQAKSFVEKRIADIDLISSGRSSWKILPLGAFEGFDWSFKTGGFNIFSKKSFSPSCSHEMGLYISTEKWAQKIAKRHEYDYHPLLNLKSWARLPVATGYGLVAGTGAVGVGVGGCAIGAYLKDNSNEICKASIEASGYLLQQTKNLFEGTIRPDLRHWKKFPAGFLITRDEKGDPCRPSSEENFPRKKILD